MSIKTVLPLALRVFLVYFKHSSFELRSRLTFNKQATVIFTLALARHPLWLWLWLWLWLSHNRSVLNTYKPNHNVHPKFKMSIVLSDNIQMKHVVAAILFFSVQQAHAEYRVFMLLLQNSKTLTARQIQTTLDPEQYTTLYPLNEGENISYVDTWMCKGRTDFFKPHCDKPEKVKPSAATLDRSPAGVTTQSPDIKN